MAARIRGRALGDKLAAMRAARDWSPKILDRMEALVRRGDDAQLFRINPVRFAAEEGIAENEAIDAFLHASRLGMFAMEWNLVCPTCGDTVESFGALNQLNPHFHCGLCAQDFEATLDDLIQVTFTISPELRSISFHHPDLLLIEDFHLKYHFGQGASVPGGPRFIDTVQSLPTFQEWLSPRQRRRCELDCDAGSLSFCDLQHHLGVSVAVSGPRAEKPQPMSLRMEGGELLLDRTMVAPGTIALTVENRGAAQRPLLVLNFPPGHEKGRVEFVPFLSGRRLLSSQAFRDLCGTEVVRGGGGLAARDITIVFAGLAGPAERRESTGDVKAFTLAHRHFERLGRIAAACSGALVKTMGDALVMASFMDPVDAMKAALEMNSEAARAGSPIAVGIHRGPCIAVTLNDRLDWFGQTVNTASRMQGLAGPQEIYVTDEVFGFPGVRLQLKGHRAFSGTVRLKGIPAELKVYKIVDGREAAAAAEPARAAGAPLTSSAVPAGAKRAP